MTYNLGNVRTRVEQRLDDTSFGVDKLNQFINDGQRDILNSRRFTFMEGEIDVIASNGTELVSGLPTNMQTPLSLRIYTPVGYAVPLHYVEYEDFDVNLPNPTIGGVSVPGQWRTFGGKVYVFPIPNADYTLRLKYIKSPTELISDADVPSIPESFSEALVLAGYKRALEHNGDFDLSQVIQAQVDDLSNKMSERHKRQSGTPHIMRLPNRVRQNRGF